MTSPVRIPADVDMADRVIGSLTARQVTILGLTGLGLYAAWDATRHVVPVAVFLALAVPVAVTAVVLALGRRDGVSMDRLFLAAIRHRVAPRTRTAHPVGDSRRGDAPAWLDARGRPANEPAARGRRGVLRLPARSVTAGNSGTDVGMVDLGVDGLATVAVASTVNFALRTPAEQQGLVAVFGRYLHSLSAPVQILIRAQPLDLTGQVEDLRARAGELPHPALQAAAREHADYLTRLAEHGVLLRRQVLLVLHEPLGPTGPVDGLGGPSPLAAARAGLASLRGRHRPADPRPPGGGARRAAEARLVRRLGEAMELLAPAGITITPLDAARITAVLAAACNPDPLLAPTPRRAGTGEIVYAAPGPTYWEGDDPDEFEEPSHDREHDGWIDDGWDDDGWDYDTDDATPPSDDEDRDDDLWDGRRPRGSGRTGTPRRSRAWATRRRSRCWPAWGAAMSGGRRTGRRRPRAAGVATPAFVPDTLTVGARHLEIGGGIGSGEHVASLVVVGFPREVHPGWLDPLLTHPGRIDVAVHVEPVDPVTAATRLRSQLAKLESGRRSTAEHGRLFDPHVEAATEDAYDLSSRVARGEGRLFRVGLYLTVHAGDAAELADEIAAVRALCASLLMDARHTTYRALAGWVATLPMGLDPVGMRRTFDTSALSAAFPFTSPDLPAADPAGAAAPDGVLYGYNLGSQGLVHVDRFAAPMHNHNAVVLGRSGAGKSYLVKLELLRSLHRGVEALVIDPEDEYTRLSDAVGGTRIDLGEPGIRLNPFDLPIHTGPDGRRHAPRDALARRSLFLHTAVAVLLGDRPDPGGRAALDRAITATYTAAGITADPATWTRPAPLLRDLRDTLAEQEGPGVGRELAERLHPFVDGSFNGLFDGPTTTRPEGHLVVFSLRELPDELKATGTLLTLDAIWRQVTNPALRRPRLVVVDEAWLLMQDRAGAEFLFRMAKASRKHWAGLTVATQDTADVLGTDLGKAVVANAATQILLRQSTQAIDEVTRVFDLSAGERQFLLSADRGQGLLSTGSTRVAFHAAASELEDSLATSSPAQLAEQDTDRHGDHDDEDVASGGKRNGDGWIDLDTSHRPDRRRRKPDSAYVSLDPQ